MDRAYLLEVARRSRRLTQAEVAARSGTSQATLSAYERGLKSPSLKVASRILEAIGFDLNLRVHIDWVEHEAPGAGRFWVPNLLWSVDMPHCFATLRVPDDDGAIREWDLHDREQRKSVYEYFILHGTPDQMIRWVDGPFLVDVWDELHLPEPVRSAWRWAILIAREPTTGDAWRLGRDWTLTDSAWIRTYDALPRKTKKSPAVRFVPTRFDPQRRSHQTPGADQDAGPSFDLVKSVAAVADRLVGELPTTRYPSVRATWNTGVAFARRWAELEYDEDMIALTPRIPGCVVRVVLGPFDDKDALVEQLRRM